MSASTVVVSALLPVVREAFHGQHGRAGWLATTIEPASGRSVKLQELFASPDGIRVLGKAWRSRLPGDVRECVDDGAFGAYNPNATYFRKFALTPQGIAIGVASDSYCGAWYSVVPYGVLRSDLSKIGSRLVGGVRPPQ